MPTLQELLNRFANCETPQPIILQHRHLPNNFADGVRQQGLHDTRFDIYASFEG